MIKIYHKSQKKLGYLYFSGRAGNYINHVKKFKDQYELKSFLIGLSLESFKFDLEAFIVMFNESEKCSTHLEEKSLATIEKFQQWVHTKDIPPKKIMVQFKRLKEEFITIIKAAGESQDQLFMLYKSMGEDHE